MIKYWNYALQSKIYDRRLKRRMRRFLFVVAVLGLAIAAAHL